MALTDCDSHRGPSGQEPSSGEGVPDDALAHSEGLCPGPAHQDGRKGCGSTGPRANPGAPGVRYRQLLSGAGKVGTVMGTPFHVPLAGGEAGPLGS